ncbi:MAG: hypothetical protein R3F20_10280 [Planctomycetota bacterium]
MNFEEFWQENKSFLLKIAAGGLLFFVGWLIVTSLFEEDIDRDTRRASRSASAARKLKLPPGTRGEADAKLEELQAQLAAVEKELIYVPDPGFTLRGASGSTDVYFNDVVQRLTTDLVDGASSLDIRIDSGLGLADVTPRSDPEREWYLNGLDVVRRVCLAGVASGVESIEPIKIARPPKSRRAEADRGLLKAVPVEFVAVGSAIAIDGLLRSLELPGRRLSVVRAAITSLEGDRNAAVRFGGESLVRLDLSVEALQLDAVADEDDQS